MRHAGGAGSAGRTAQPTVGWYDADSVTYHGHVDARDAASSDGHDLEVVAARAGRDTWVSEFDH